MSTRSIEVSSSTAICQGEKDRSRDVRKWMRRTGAGWDVWDGRREGTWGWELGDLEAFSVSSPSHRLRERTGKRQQATRKGKEAGQQRVLPSMPCPQCPDRPRPPRPFVPSFPRRCCICCGCPLAVHTKTSLWLARNPSFASWDSSNWLLPARVPVPKQSTPDHLHQSPSSPSSPCLTETGDEESPICHVATNFSLVPATILFFLDRRKM